MVFEEGFVVETKGFTDVLDVTPQVERIVSASGVRSGIVLAFTPGSTAGLTTIEYEPGAVSDLKDAVARIAPEGIAYAHDARWGDGNGFSHVRAALLGPSLALPLRGGALLTGTWQQIVLVDFDNRPRSRRVEVQILGENP
ncbi:MAG: YjbQ family protein [Nitrospinae bacterium]|nr:YjbQ family protein [Nitrospinota bacterium]